MTNLIEIVNGLGGAIGCDYQKDSNQLVFVEYAKGQISRLNILRPLDAVVFSGTVIMSADSSLNLSDGTSAQGGQIRWDHINPNADLNMRPQGTCELAYIGNVDFDMISSAELQNLKYSQNALPGNKLKNGDVFAVYNWDPQPNVDYFDYAKIQVIKTGNNIEIQWVSYKLKDRYTVLGTGYDRPEDVEVKSDERHAYVTERGGSLLRVDLENADRSAAQVINSSMDAPQQIALDENHNHAYTVEFANPGRLLRIDLNSGAETVLYSNLEWAVGLIMSKDFKFAYISEQTEGPDIGRIIRINVNNGAREVLSTGLIRPFFMAWSDSSETKILLTEREPANRVTVLDLIQKPFLSQGLVNVPSNPSSIAILSGGRTLVCCNEQIIDLDLVSDFFNQNGPMLLGIGHVPKTEIDGDGYATTDPDYHFYVINAPFGGTLPIMFNHEKAWELGARYYQILVDGVPKNVVWKDYKWSSFLKESVLTSNIPLNNLFFQVHLPYDLWHNHWLGYFLDTSGLSKGIHEIGVKIFSSPNSADEITAGADTLKVQIDNTWPRAKIEEIWQDGKLVKTCQIVDSGPDEFTFKIKAFDPEEHLLSWSLVAEWGENQSKSVDDDSYTNHMASSAPKKWFGVDVADVIPDSGPPWNAEVPGDPTSKQCAHTFRLGVWDRVINGWNHLHYSEYHKSITIWL